MEPYAGLGEAEMEPHADPGRWEKPGRKRSGGIEWFPSVPVFRRTARGIHRGAAEEAYRRSAEGREAFLDEIQPVKGEGGGTR